MGIVVASMAMMVRLTAEETLVAAQAVAVGRWLKPEDGTFDRWRSVARGEVTGRPKMPTPEAHRAAGIGVRMLPPRRSDG